LDWLIENKYAPEIDFFSGEPFAQELGFTGLKLILDKFKNVKKKPQAIVVPTNYTFIMSKEKTARVEKLLNYAKKVKIPMYLSASFDGKYCEKNRPLRTGEDTRDDAYYDRCFAFNRKWGFGFHPMVNSVLIENWKDNFLWFQEKMKEHNIVPWSLYLLEVRNSEWTDRQYKHFIEFLDFLVGWTFDFCNRDKNKFIEAVFHQKGFNILMNSFSQTGRGIGCSIQATLQVRLGNLTIVPCHRTSYESFVGAEFVVKNNKIVGIESRNLEMMIGTTSFTASELPYCETCPLKYLCAKGCLGSQFETNGDPFLPIPTVCKLEHAKVYGLVMALKKYGLYDIMYLSSGPRQKLSLDLIEQLLLKNQNHG
jgi:radical SAM protein with 4Fe4S-binding SPASM domain